VRNIIRSALNEIYVKQNDIDIIKECTIAGVRIDDGIVLAKNRDRGYKARVEIIHELINDVEIVYWRDIDTDWSEGMNEYGISIVNSALSTAVDEKEGEKVLKKRNSKNDKTEKQVNSKDGEKIREALTKKDMKSVVKSLIEFTGSKSKWGLRGETFVTNGETLYSIELTSKHTPIISKMKPETKVIIRTNHGIHHKTAGYTSGEKKESSHKRLELAKKHLNDVKTDMDVINKMKKKYDKNPFMNPYRTKNMYNMQTTGQILLNPEKKLVFVRMDNEMGQLVGIKVKLPKGYKPKIKIEVESEKTYEKEKKLQESTKKIPTNKVGKDQNLVKSMNNYFVEILQKKDKKNNISNNTGIKIVNNELRILKKEILENL